MNRVVYQSEIAPVPLGEYDYLPLVDAENGCQAGCRAGLLRYTQEAYRQGGVHEDQEGFYVLEGRGSALVGEEEISLSPGACFIVPPGYYHSIKRESSCPYIALFFFHAAV